MELLIVLFVLASLVWLLPLIRSGRYSVVALAVLGVGTVFGPAFFALPGPIQISLDRLLWATMLLLAVIGWRLDLIKLPALTRVDWLVVAIVGWLLISCLRGGPVPTGSSPVARWLFYIAMPAGMYAFARMLRLRHADVHWMLAAAVGLGIYLSLTGLLELASLHAWVFPRYIADPQVWEFYGRARGPLMNPAGNGFLLSLSAVAATLGILHGGRVIKAVSTLALLLILGGVYATLTRSVWIGAVAAIAAAGFWFTARWTRVLGLASVVVLALALVGGMKEQLAQMNRDKHLSAAAAEKSIELRPLLAVVAWEMFQDRPLIGHGYGHYFEHKDRYYSNRSYDLPLEQAREYAQHNVFLSVLVDTGLIGLSLFVAWLVSLTAIACRMAREMPTVREKRATGLLLLGALAAYVCNGMFHDVMIIPMVHMFLFFVAGMAVTAAQSGVQQPVGMAARARSGVGVRTPSFAATHNPGSI